MHCVVTVAQLDSLILIKSLLEVVHSWRIELGLRILCAKVQRVNMLVDVGPLMVEVPLFLLALVLTHETCLEDTGCDP